MKANLAAIGVDVEVRHFPHGVLFAKVGTKGEPFDIALTGWAADYPDPFNFLNNLLEGTRIRASGNSNMAYFDDPTQNRRLKPPALPASSATAPTASWTSISRGMQRRLWRSPT